MIPKPDFLAFLNDFDGDSPPMIITSKNPLTKLEKHLVVRARNLRNNLSLSRKNRLRKIARSYKKINYNAFTSEALKR